MAKLKNKYYADVRLFWTDEDGEYTADIDNLQLDTGEEAVGSNLIGGPFISISAGGKTPRSALKELGVALQLALETYEEDNKT